MKKILFSVLCLACAAMTFTACSEADEFTESKDINAARGLTFVAGMPGIIDDTRTMVSDDGEGNYVPMWSNVPYIDEKGNMTQVPDFIYGYFEGQKRLYKFNISKTTNLPDTVAEFQEELITGKNTFLEDFNASGAKVAYFAKNNTPSTNFDETGVKISKTEYTPTQLSPTMLNGDILITDSITAEDINKGVSNLRFKRLTGVIRLNIIAGEGVDLSNELFMIIGLSNPEHTDAYGNMASMQYIDSYVNPKTGEIIPYNKENNFADAENYAFDKNSYFYFDIVQPKDSTYTNYLVSNPLELKEGQKLKLKIQTFNKQITKEMTVGAEGFKIEAGKITTMNVTINMMDMPGATQIKAGTPGSLDENAIEKIVKNIDEKGLNTIPVVGELNAHDIGVLREVFSKDVVNGKTYTLDFYNSYFISDDSSYSGPDGETVTIPKPDVMPRFMFYGMKRVHGLILPFGISKIMTGAISMDNLLSIDIPKHVSEIESEAICLNTESNNTVEVSMNIHATPQSLNKLQDGFCTNADYNIKVILGLDSSWFTNEPNAPRPSDKPQMWKGFEWNKIHEL